MVAPSVAGAMFIGFVLWIGNRGEGSSSPISAPLSAPEVAEQRTDSVPGTVNWCAEPILRYTPSRFSQELQSLTTVVRLQWTHAGQVFGAIVEGASGDSLLDAAAIQAVTEARVCDDRAGEGIYAVQYTPENIANNVAPPETSAKSELVAAAVPTPTVDFPLIAELHDVDGEIVLQAKPSMFGKNVARLPQGMLVLASTREGKWILIRTIAGDLGYVRQRQLNFKEN